MRVVYPILDASLPRPHLRLLARAQGYTAGWKECANALIDTADSAARALGKVRRDAIEAYNEAYRRTEGAQS